MPTQDGRLKEITMGHLSNTTMTSKHHDWKYLKKSKQWYISNLTIDMYSCLFYRTLRKTASSCEVTLVPSTVTFMLTSITKTRISASFRTIVTIISHLTPCKIPKVYLVGIEYNQKQNYACYINNYLLNHIKLLGG